ncbi:MAG: hypothetical protein WD717_06735 [Nitrosarchaeum sp.]
MNKNDVDVVVTENPEKIIPLSIIRLPTTFIKSIDDYLNLKFNNNKDAKDVNYQNELEHIFNLGLKEAKFALYSDNSSLLHKGKKPRIDVWYNLGRIVDELVKCNTYPLIDASYLVSILNKSLGDRDERTIKDYKKTVLSYCNINQNSIDKCSDSRFGELDVTLFVALVPKQYRNNISTTTSTSSFGSKYE